VRTIGPASSSGSIPQAYAWQVPGCHEAEDIFRGDHRAGGEGLTSVHEPGVAHLPREACRSQSSRCHTPDHSAGSNRPQAPGYHDQLSVLRSKPTALIGAPDRDLAWAPKALAERRTQLDE
jgi:hypothetical protein